MPSPATKRYEVAVAFTAEKDTPLTVALKSLRGLDVEAPTSEIAEHHGALIVKALEQAIDEWWKR